uniref:Alanine--glyoxylate aminotransferase family protein n=1 Tax=Fervidicoccus fontis TaxID=683846 RepID=A0A7J3ZIQ8_9CREN
MTRYYTDRYILSPGPTEIPNEIRLALARETTNPDLDPSFKEEYLQATRKISYVIGARDHSVLIMLGEAMLGLEASVASILDRGDKAIVVANGVFGEGFADLVRAYGGEPVVVELDWRRSANPEKVIETIELNPDAKALYMVHCETPTAILNSLAEIGRRLQKASTLFIVDAVSSIGGVKIDASEWGIDILIGGSQKALNLPSGLTILAVSEKAWDAIGKRGPKGFYLNLALWRDYIEKEEMPPYTLSDSMVSALNRSLDMILSEGLESVFRRHQIAQKACWHALRELGLEPYPRKFEDSSPTVTAAIVPEAIDSEILRAKIWNRYGVMLGGGIGRVRGRVIRIGHMGVTASRNHVLIGVAALARGLLDEGIITLKEYSRAVEAAERAFE